MWRPPTTRWCRSIGLVARLMGYCRPIAMPNTSALSTSCVELCSPSTHRQWHSDPSRAGHDCQRVREVLAEADRGAVAQFAACGAENADGLRRRIVGNRAHLGLGRGSDIRCLVTCVTGNVGRRLPALLCSRIGSGGGRGERFAGIPYRASPNPRTGCPRTHV